MYYGILPMPEQSCFLPTAWTSSRLYFNMAANFAGFYATALLTSYLSEKLQRTSRELDANRQNLAELRALNQNVVESIPSGLITVSSYGTAAFVNPAGVRSCRSSRSRSSAITSPSSVSSPYDEWNDAREELAAGEVVRREIDNSCRRTSERSIGFAVSPLSTLDGRPPATR